MKSPIYLSTFAMPKPVRITGRSSSITNSFVNGVIPVVVPTEAEVRAALEILDMLDRVSSSYCGDTSTEWDHLRPLVSKQRPTGKGNKDWLTWMRSSAPLSPKSRGVADIEDRIARLQEYERRASPTRVDFEAVVGTDLWQRHWAHHKHLLELMRVADQDAQEIRTRVREAHEVKRQAAT